MVSLTCRGPPPLPPGKRLLQRATRKLNGVSPPTYRSFRDPSLEAWIPPSQRVSTPGSTSYDYDEDDLDEVDGFDFSGIKLIDEARLDDFSYSLRDFFFIVRIVCIFMKF